MDIRITWSFEESFLIIKVLGRIVRNNEINYDILRKTVITSALRIINLAYRFKGILIEPNSSYNFLKQNEMICFFNIIFDTKENLDSFKKNLNKLN